MVRDSVVWKSLSKKINLNGKLTWDENKRKLYSDKVVRVTTETEYITGKGFEANQSFQVAHTNKSNGTIAVRCQPIWITQSLIVLVNQSTKLSITFLILTLCCLPFVYGGFSLTVSHAKNNNFWANLIPAKRWGIFYKTKFCPTR